MEDGDVFGTKFTWRSVIGAVNKVEEKQEDCFLDEKKPMMGLPFEKKRLAHQFIEVTMMDVKRSIKDKANGTLNVHFSAWWHFIDGVTMVKNRKYIHFDYGASKWRFFTKEATALIVAWRSLMCVMNLARFLGINIFQSHAIPIIIIRKRGTSTSNWKEYTLFVDLETEAMKWLLSKVKLSWNVDDAYCGMKSTDNRMV